MSELTQKLADGAITAAFGPRMADHFRHAFRDANEILLDDADLLAAASWASAEWRMRSFRNSPLWHCGDYGGNYGPVFRKLLEVTRR